MMSTSTWSRCGLIFLGSVFLYAPSLAQTQNEPLPIAMLRWVMDTEEHIPFTGRQEVVISTGATAKTTITRETHLGLYRGRIEYLFPKSAAGRLVVSDGKYRWEYHPYHHVVFRSRIVQNAKSSPGSNDVIQRIQHSYRLKVDDDLSAISGRQVYVLRIVPIRPDRPKQVWWVDAETGLVLKREKWDLDGRLISISVYTDLKFHPSITTDQIAFKPEKGVQIVDRNDPAPVSTIRQARRIAPRWGRVPATIGQGFEFASAQIVKIKGTSSLNLQYSDGLISLSFIQIPGSAAITPGHVSSHRVHLGPSDATVVQMSPFHILSWSTATTTFSLVANLAEKTLLTIARGLR